MNKPIWLTLGIVVIVGIIFAVWQVMILRTAHSAFDNYYAFRGCQKLLSKTDTYGTCSLKDGSVIKIVRYDNRWYLDGDLPNCGYLFCI